MKIYKLLIFNYTTQENYKPNKMEKFDILKKKNVYSLSLSAIFLGV